VGGGAVAWGFVSPSIIDQLSALLDAAPIQDDTVRILVADHEDGARELLGDQQPTNHRLLIVLLGELRRGASGRLLASGAADVLGWEEHATLLRISRRLERWARIDKVVAEPPVASRLIGSSRPFRAFLRELVEVAMFGTGSVLLLGDSGTGKQAAAELVHALDLRPDKAHLITVDATTLIPELAGSELFGHERGSFTGATAAREGAFALADRGTLFLDEIGELPPSLQAQLLRVLQERTYKPVGANYWCSSRFRLVSATNRALDQEVVANRFRSDLFHRVATHVLRLPSLGERSDDILPLARHFFAELLPPASQVELHPELEEHLLGRAFPGNVRELRQLIESIAARYAGPGPVTLADLPRLERDEIGANEWHDTGFQTAIRRAILLGITASEIEEVTRGTTKRIALEMSSGNLQMASRQLGLTERALQKWRAGQNGRSAS
jgi:transcriptional regulator with GAF, ATPase, and Fis domain